MKPQTQARVGEVQQVAGRLEAAFNARDPAALAALAAVSSSTGVERAGEYVLVLTRTGKQWAICADLWNLDQPLG